MSIIVNSIPLPSEDFTDLAYLFARLTNENVTVSNMGRTKVILDGQTMHTVLNMKSEVPYIRRHEGYFHTLIIQSISVPRPRNGVGTQLLTWLKGYAKSKGFNRIEIQNCVTEDSQSFCAFHGFNRTEVDPSNLLVRIYESDDFEYWL